ncbi:hypothetical protein AMTR_s00024p00127170 [Amborella trichopoda]|uniref:Uncharacterized protein n=1 Tax=Amborella trichopoda TaxID=13333 RepID=W1PUU7_AMBTC|nr:hypothetical protein AMTR_s00024p00127170 [Amborella trichopoda]
MARSEDMVNEMVDSDFTVPEKLKFNMTKTDDDERENGVVNYGRNGEILKWTSPKRKKSSHGPLNGYGRGGSWDPEFLLLRR